MKKINYYVIGGQYASYCYGGTPTLIGAKRLARKSAEYLGIDKSILMWYIQFRN